MTAPTSTAETIASSVIVDNIADLWAGIEQIREKLDGYLEAEKFYDGAQTEVWSSPKMQAKLGKAACDYYVNLAKTPVDVLTDKLEITAVTAAGGKGGKNQRAQAMLDALWKHNGLDGDGYKELIRAANKFGDEFLYVWRSERVPGMVDILANDPTTTTIVYDTENPAVPLYAAKLWQWGKRQRADLIYWDGLDDRGQPVAGRIEKYVTKIGTKGGDQADWTTYQDDTDEAWPLPNPDGKSVFHIRNRKPWGLPVHKGAYGPQNAITKLLATEMDTVDYHGAPIRYALQDATVQDEDDLDDFGVDDAAEPPEPVGESHRGAFRSTPGDVWYLKGVKSVGQFTPADPKVLTDPAELFVRFMAQTTNMAFHYFDPSGVIPSGESLKVADAPTNKLAGDLETAYTAGLVDALEHALVLLGTPATVTISWASSQQVDDLEVQELVALKIANGVPPSVALTEAGYTDEQIKEWGVPTVSQPVERAPIGPGKNALGQPNPPIPRLAPKVT